MCHPGFLGIELILLRWVLVWYEIELVWLLGFSLFTFLVDGVEHVHLYAGWDTFGVFTV